jgi:predicted nucleic acid-binding protein
VTHAFDTDFLVAVEVNDHAEHAGCRATVQRLATAGDDFALAPQIVAEFLHVVTDARRFPNALDMDAAVVVAERWWTARNTIQLAPSDLAVCDFLGWVRQFRLGRKRLLDTLYAATLQDHGITSILSLNGRDFTIFGGFTIISPDPVIPYAE